MPDSAADDDDDADTGFVSHVQVHVPLPLPAAPSLQKMTFIQLTNFPKKVIVH